MVFSAYVKSFQSNGADAPSGISFEDLLTLKIAFKEHEEVQELDLQQWLGNENGRFKLGGKDFARNALNPGVVNTMLTADLPFGAPLPDGRILRVSTRINLDLCFDFVPGDNQHKAKVVFRHPSENIQDGCGRFELHGTLLSALCLGHDGALHASIIDLRKYIHCDYASGKLTSDPNRAGLDHRTANLELNGWKLSGTMKHNKGRIAEFDLSQYLKNNDGQLEWLADGWFERDGPLATHSVNFPVLGIIAAKLHEAAGNKDHANNALAISTNCTIIFAGGLLAGILSASLALPLGTGAIVAAVTAAALTPLATEVEHLIKNGTINEEKKRTIEKKLQIYIKDAVINSCVAGATPLLRSWLFASKIKPAPQSLRKSIMQWLSENGKEYIISIPLAEAYKGMWDTAEKTAWDIVNNGVSDASKEL